MGEALLYVNEHASAEIAGHPGSNGLPTWDFESFELADGRSVHVMGLPEQLFPLLAAMLPIPGAIEDARFATLEARAENRKEMLALLDAELLKVADHAALEKLLEGSPAIVVPVRTTQELAASDWASDREALTNAGPGLEVPTAPWRSRDLAVGVREGRIAYRGEDNRAVLSEWLGRSQDATAKLEERGVLQASPSEPPPLDEAPRTAFRDEATDDAD